MKTKTKFAMAVRLCGHTYETLAAALDAREDTVRQWMRGRRSVPPYAWERLREDYAALWEGADDLPPANQLAAEALAELRGDIAG